MNAKNIPLELQPHVIKVDEDLGIWTIKEESIESVATMLLLLGCYQNPPRTDVVDMCTPDGEHILIHDWLWVEDYILLTGDQHGKNDET